MDFKSSISDSVAWPAVMGGAGAQLAATLLQFQYTELLSEPALRERQLGQLGRLLHHTYGSVAFYRDALDTIAYKPGQAISQTLWQSLPLLTRDEIQVAGRSLHSTRVPESHGAVKSNSTSGSTGQALRVRGTQLNNFFWMAYTLREHVWHQRDAGKKLAIIRYLGEKSKAGAPPGGTESEDWGKPLSYLFATGRSALLDINTDTMIQVQWLRDQEPSYLLTYPSNLEALANYCLRNDICVKGIEQIRTISETLPPSLRELCREAFGAEIVDIYSSNEVGYIAIQCPDCKQYHVQSENLVCEVIDAAGKPCAPGETGRVVVTPLHNFAMPLLRYEIRDYAVVGQPGQCKRNLPTLERIVGRSRNMLKLPNGDTRWPSFLSWTELAPIAQYQIIQHTVHQLEAKLVTHRPLTAEDERTLSTALREQFGEPFDIEYTYLPTIRGHENGKFEVFISKVG